MTRYREVNALRLVDAAYIGGLVDGEGTVTLSRKHTGEQRQLVVSISNTERALLAFVLLAVGAGKITRKRIEKPHHSPSMTYAIWNRQALRLLEQIEPFMHSYKRDRARLIRADYVRLTPRNGKYTLELLAQRQHFERDLLALRTRAARQPPAPPGGNGLR